MKTNERHWYHSRLLGHWVVIVLLPFSGLSGAVPRVEYITERSESEPQ